MFVVGIVGIHVAHEQEPGALLIALKEAIYFAIDDARVLVSTAGLAAAEHASDLLVHASQYLEHGELRGRIAGAEQEVGRQIAIVVEALLEVQEGSDVVVGDDATRRVAGARKTLGD